MNRNFHEYLAWLIRNAFKESGVRIDCDIFTLIVNVGSFDESDVPDTSLGYQVNVINNIGSEYPIMLITSIDWSYDSDVGKWLKAFYEMQSLSPFYEGDMWWDETNLN